MHAAAALGRCAGRRAFRQSGLARIGSRYARLSSTRALYVGESLLVGRVDTTAGRRVWGAAGPGPLVHGHAWSAAVLSTKRSFSSDLPSHEVVGLPALSPTMETGTISEWKVKEGDSFAAGDIICNVETDKATVEYEAQDEGVLAKILVQAGTPDVPVGTAMMVVVEDADSAPAFANFNIEAGSVAAATAAPVAAPAAAPAAGAGEGTAAATAVAEPATGATGGRVFASPLARRLAEQGVLNLSDIPGTGPGGRIIAADVREFVPSIEKEAVMAPAGLAAAQAVTPSTDPGPARVSPDGAFVDYPVSEKAIAVAARLTHSKQTVPHYYLTVDLKLDSILEVREKLNSGLPEGQQLSLGDMLLKAAAIAAKKVPDVNASWMDTFVRQFSSCDVNLVIGAGDSVVAPVVRDVGGRGIKSISDEVRDLAARASAGDLEPHQVEAGTFTVANLGAYGVKSFAPVVHTPQACVLAIGAAEERVIPNEDPASEQVYQVSTMLSATLSCDHRVVDGAVSAEYLAAFRTLVENPITMLL